MAGALGKTYVNGDGKCYNAAPMDMKRQGGE